MATAPAGTPYTAISLNLGVTVDATKQVEILNRNADAVADAVICSVQMPHTSLYDASSQGVFMFWESVNRDTVSGEVIPSAGSHGLTRGGGDLAANLRLCLVGGLDATAAPIFSTYPAVYQTPSSVGELALSYAAHGLFGHVAATAAITNDTSIVSYMNGTGGTNADLGKLLEDAIYALTAAEVSTLAQKVIGQDAARARDEDNNEFEPEVRHALPFMAGDVIFVAVQLVGWTSANENVDGADDQADLGSALTAQTFTFEITLS